MEVRQRWQARTNALRPVREGDVPQGPAAEHRVRIPPSPSLIYSIVQISSLLPSEDSSGDAITAPNLSEAYPDSTTTRGRPVKSRRWQKRDDADCFHTATPNLVRSSRLPVEVT